MGKIINQTTQKRIRLLVNWRNSKINFGILEFMSDGSLIYAPSFYKNLDEYPFFDIGRWNDKDKLGIKERREKNIKGVHVSLHPREDVLHIRQKDENGEDQTIVKKSFKWFPVLKETIFIIIVSPPLDKCLPTKKSLDKEFDLLIPSNYTNSIEILIRIFPRNTQNVSAFKVSPYHVFGHCNDYLVFCDFIPRSTRNHPAIYFPVSRKK